MRAVRTPVSVPVIADVGPIEVRLHPYKDVFVPPDDSNDQPWAVGGLCRVTFRFGSPQGLQVSKRVTAWYRWYRRFGWPDPERPSEAAIAEGRRSVEHAIRDQLERHGIDHSAVKAVDMGEVEPVEHVSWSGPVDF
jgi:hypothetical protein